MSCMYPMRAAGQVVQSLLTGTTQLGSTALPAGEPWCAPGRWLGWWSVGTRAGRRCRRCRPWWSSAIPTSSRKFSPRLFAPAGTPSDVVNLLTAEVAKLSKDPDVIEKAEPRRLRMDRRGPRRRAAQDGGGDGAITGSAPVLRDHGAVTMDDVCLIPGLVAGKSVSIRPAALDRRTRGITRSGAFRYTSTLAVSAFCSMNARRGSTLSPISSSNMVLASSISFTFTCSSERALVSSVVSQSCSGFISPRPL